MVEREGRRGKESWIDISVPLGTGMPHYPGDPPVQISRLSGSRPDEPLVSHISCCVHAGTHIDAPLHFFPGDRGIDAMPADAMMGPARIISVGDRDIITPSDLESHDITSHERILFKTRNSALWASEVFTVPYVHLSSDCASFLAAKKITAVGIDYLSIGGFAGNEAEVHGILLKAGIWIIEGLDLSGVEPGLYYLVCLPLRLHDTEAAPARAMVRPIVP